MESGTEEGDERRSKTLVTMSLEAGLRCSWLPFDNWCQGLLDKSGGASADACESMMGDNDEGDSVGAWPWQLLGSTL